MPLFLFFRLFLSSLSLILGDSVYDLTFALLFLPLKGKKRWLLEQAFLLFSIFQLICCCCCFLSWVVSSEYNILGLPCCIYSSSNDLFCDCRLSFLLFSLSPLITCYGLPCGWARQNKEKGKERDEKEKKRYGFSIPLLPPSSLQFTLSNTSYHASDNTCVRLRGRLFW